MLRTRYPRVFELIDLIEDRDNPNAYFREFESRVVQNSDMERVWVAREVELDLLDEVVWDNLKKSAAPYLIKKSGSERGWSQLICALNEARGYIYLLESGYSNIEFIPPERKSGIETPDLKAFAEHGSALLEVKTLQISEEEIRAQTDITARSTETALSEGFLEKLGKTICKARSQLFSYEIENVATRIIFVIPNFDDWLGEYKSNYYTDIDNYLKTNAPDDCRVVFFNSRTAFHAEISMQNAQVVNE